MIYDELKKIPIFEKNINESIVLLKDAKEKLTRAVYLVDQASSLIYTRGQVKAIQRVLNTTVADCEILSRRLSSTKQKGLIHGLRLATIESNEKK